MKRCRQPACPCRCPFGGHAIFIDAGKFLPQVPAGEFPAQRLAVEIYLEGGIRGTEIGTLMADRDPVTRQNRHPGAGAGQACHAKEGLYRQPHGLCVQQQCTTSGKTALDHKRPGHQMGSTDHEALHR
ncbi:MAG: hypothetical protein MZV63_62685 [Marinilabiliales bacterium]|nr:hypothetical protein [Marinilabiliales bacterium]